MVSVLLYFVMLYFYVHNLTGFYRRNFIATKKLKYFVELFDGEIRLATRLFYLPNINY